VLAQARRSLVRTAVLGLGILVAAVSFSLLTASVRTTRAQVRGTLSSSYRPAYDILVRPAGAQSALERGRGLVQADFESGIYGGITNTQWRQVLKTPGVSVAAPIANVGVVYPDAELDVPVPQAASGPGEHLFRFHLTWSATQGTARFAGEEPFIFVTDNPDTCSTPFLQHADPEPAYPNTLAQAQGSDESPFYCFVRHPPANGKPTCYSFDPAYSDSANQCTVYLPLIVHFPLLVAGIDPVQENRLLHLSKSLVDGVYLGETQTYTQADWGPDVPVLLSTRSYVDAGLTIAVQSTNAPTNGTLSQRLAHAPLRGAPTAAWTLLRGYRTTTVGTDALNSRALYTAVIDGLAGRGEAPNIFSIASVHYGDRAGVLRPQIVPDDPSAWTGGGGNGGMVDVPINNVDTHFRVITRHDPVNSVAGAGYATFEDVGDFDPTKLPGFSPLSAVPLGAYDPAAATGADPASRAALHGQPLRPTLNLAGLLTSPPYLLTTLAGAHGLTSELNFSGFDDAAPISVIRVRVAGVTGPDKTSINRVKTAANLIHQRTGLAVDITAGSSPAPQTIAVPASRYGTPPLLLHENWVKKGVVLLIVGAVDRKSLLLLVLILVVTAVFLTNAGISVVHSRRREFGTLLCLGWRPRSIFGLAIGELVGVGALAGVVGLAVAFALSATLGLHQPAWQLALVLPVSVALATTAGLAPALLAAQGEPLDVMEQTTTSRQRSRTPRRLTGLAWANLQATKARTVLASLALYTGIAALAILAGISASFHGDVNGTVLGDYVSVQVRHSDYISLGLALLLAGAALGDTVVLSIRERATELVTLRVNGWTNRSLAQLVSTEGLITGAAASILGGLTGVTVGLGLGEPANPVLATAALATLGGILVAAIASILPAITVARLPIGLAAAEA